MPGNVDVVVAAADWGPYICPVVAVLPGIEVMGAPDKSIPLLAAAAAESPPFSQGFGGEDIG